jgi:hypothetical protein
VAWRACGHADVRAALARILDRTRLAA